MNEPDDFDIALDQAFSSSDQLDGACDWVRKLVEGFSRSVQGKTAGTVSISLADSNPSSLAGAMEQFMGLGRVKKAREPLRRWVVARGQGGGYRILWSLVFDKNAGYPIEVVEEDDTSHNCYSADDVRSMFLQLASAGVTGTKIKDLQTRQVKGLGQADDASDPEES